MTIFLACFLRSLYFALSSNRRSVLLPIRGILYSRLPALWQIRTIARSGNKLTLRSPSG